MVLKYDRGIIGNNRFINLNLSLRLKNFKPCVLVGLKTYALDLWLESVIFGDFHLIFPTLNA